MNNIILIGMPGAGKTTIGKLLSEKINYNFLDTDTLISENLKEDISNFRKKETEVLERLLNKQIQNTVISTGGGIILSNYNNDILKKLGTIIFLNRDIEKIALDIDLSRSLFKNKGKLELINIYNSRINIYKDICDYEVVNKSITDTVNDIIDKKH